MDAQRASARSVVLVAVKELVAIRGHAVRVGDVHAHLAATCRAMPSLQVTRTLDGLRRTGHLVVVDRTYGLRSGGRRMFAPVGATLSPLAEVASQPLAARVLAAIASEEQRTPGVRLSTSEVLRLLNSKESDRDASGPMPGWGAVYGAIRNLERRREPLVKRETDARGHVFWSWVPVVNRDVVLEAAVGGVQSKTQPVWERRFGQHTSKLLISALARLYEKSRQRVFTTREVLGECTTDSQRNEMRRELRRVLAASRLPGKRRESAEERVEIGGEAPALHVLGWLDRECYIADKAHPIATKEFVTMREALRLECINRQMRRTNRLLCRSVRLQWLMELNQATILHRVSEVLLALHEGLADCDADSPLGRRTAADLTRGARLREQLQQDAGGAGADTIGATAERMITFATLHHVLQNLLGPSLPSPVNLRRCLSASHVWRCFTQHSAAGPTCRVTVNGPTGEGREAVLWEETGALMFIGVRFGGLRTRALLRTASRLVGEGRPERQKLVERELRPNFCDSVAAYLLLRRNAPERTDGGTAADSGTGKGRPAGAGGRDISTPTQAWLASTSLKLIASGRESEFRADCEASHAEPSPWAD